MDAAIVLNVRVLADRDVIIVATDRDLMPDAAVCADAHRANDGAGRRNARRWLSISGTRSMKRAI